MPNLSFGLGANSFGKEKLKVGMIGVGLRGTNRFKQLQRDDVSVTAICDIDPNRISIALDKIEKAGQKKEKYLVTVTTITEIYWK